MDQTNSAVINPRLWVEKYADYLYAYALMRLNQEELARDLVQETFLAALEKVDQFAGKSSERTWLTAILKYKIIDVYRKRASGLRAEAVGASGRGASGGMSPLVEDGGQIAEFFEADSGHWKEEYSPKEMGGDAQDPIIHKELRSILQRCLRQLPSLWLSVFTMKHMDELPTEAICVGLKVSPANFWVIMHRAKVNLRACLQKNWL